MSNKRVLVLLSSYNGEKYIADQIDSVLNQRYPFVDLLIRDDGSSDRTTTIIKEFQTKTDRIKLISGENIGYIKSFFALLKVAEGYDYYALCDQDDWWMETKIEDAVCWLDKANSQKPLLYASSSTLVDSNKSHLGLTQLQNKPIGFRNTIIQNILPGHEQVMNEEMLSYFKKDYEYSKIYVHDSWITVIASIFGEIIFDNTPHTYYRQHDNNEVGFGKGTLGWVKERMKRIKNEGLKAYAIQIEYVYQCFQNDMNVKDKKELERFLNSQANLLKRIWYALTTKFYRQKKMESILYRFSYLLGLYKTK